MHLVGIIISIVALNQSCYFSSLFSHKRHKMAPIYGMFRQLIYLCLVAVLPSRTCAEPEQMPQVQKLRPEDTAYFMANDAACVQKTCHLRTRVSKTNKQDVSCFKLSCCPPALVSDGTLNLQKQSFLFVIKSNPAPFYPKQRSVRVENNKQNTRTEVGRKPTRNTPGEK